MYQVVWAGPSGHQEEEIAWGMFMPEADLITKLGEWRFVPDGLVAFRQYLNEVAAL